MLSQFLLPEIQDLINNRDLSSIREVLSEWSPADIAELIELFPPQEQAILFRILPKDLETDTFEYLSVDDQITLIKAMGNEEVGAILNDMSPDDRTALLEEVPASIAKQMLMLLSHDERAVAKKLLGYPEYSVGRLMTPDYISVEGDWTVKEVLDHIREEGKDSETINIIYVTNNKGQLIDDIRIREFLFAPYDAKVSDLTDGNYVQLYVNDEQEKAVELFKKYDRIALPVTDQSGILIGIVTVDDVFDVAEEEATEDIQKLGAVEALDQPYNEIPFFEMIKKRAGWLSVLFIGETMTSSAMSYFEHELQKALILIIFIPLIISSGGNSGSQTATLVIRALSLGEITLKDWWFVIKREVFSGLTLGVILAGFGFAKIAIMQGITNAYGQFWYLIAFTVMGALVCIVLWGTLMGSIFPLLLKRLGFDPATSSAPFVATMVDVTGIIIYFTIATLFLRGTLL